MKVDLAASIRARLLNRAKDRGEDFSLVLNRFAVERYLYRLSLTPLRERFLLKGALLFDFWFDQPHRPTRDADFLGFGPEDARTLESAVREICQVDSEDGLRFDSESVVAEEIREDARYGGLRVKLLAHLGSSRCSVQLDVGYGDAVTPGPQEIEYPSLLDDLPAARLRVYPRETVLAEKFDAIVSLGMANSRMKDLFDIRALIREGEMDVGTVAKAIAATTARRGTTLPAELPVGLSEEFATDPGKLRQWNAFLGKNRLEAPGLQETIAEIRDYLRGPMHIARAERHRS